MGSDPNKIGLQHKAFQVGRNTLLAWVNKCFNLGYTKVEQLHTGAAYCQMLDCLYGSSKGFKMKKVNWFYDSNGKEINYHNDGKISDNWDKVTKCLSKHSQSRELNRNRVVQGKFQDNLECLQWFKHFFQCKYTGAAYNAVARRKGKPGTSGGKVLYFSDATMSLTEEPDEGISMASVEVKSNKKSKKKKAGSKGGKKRKGKKSPKTRSSGLDKDALEKENSTLTLTVEAVEKERNFYFGKLREIEILCQVEEENATDDDGSKQINVSDHNEKMKAFKDQVLKIMYKTDEDGEMIAPEDAASEGDEANKSDEYSQSDQNITF